MKSTEGMADQTARDLFAMVFDEGGAAVPPDDLAPAAMAGYRRWRRWRTAAVGAGATAAAVGVASAALVMAGGGGSGAGTTPGQPGSSTPTQGALTSAVGADSSHVVDCFTNFAAHGGNLAKLRADCTQAEGLWRAVFPGDAVSGARDPSVKQIANGFLARLSEQDASAPSLYGQAQPRVVQDWAQARQEDANAGEQSWSGFDIATGQGTITVSATFVPEPNSGLNLPCGGLTFCFTVPLSDTSTAEVLGTTKSDDYQVTVRSPAGTAYRFGISSWQDPRYVDVPCSAPGGSCYADLTDGSIKPGAVPDVLAVVGMPVVTHGSLVALLQRPAFAELVKQYFQRGLGQTSAGS